MKFLSLIPIRTKLALLVLFAVLPALAILFYSGLEQRQQSIEDAKQNVLLLTHTMAEAQKEITSSTRQTLSILSLLPAINAMDLEASRKILRAVLEQNPTYSNIALADLNGKVLVSGGPFTAADLADRKHFREALDRKNFAAGEYIITRVGTAIPAFPFAYPVLDTEGRPKAVLVAAIKLDSFSSFFNVSALPEKSFLALTDHKGVRLFYYPANEITNPIGKQVQARNWEKASKAKGQGLFIGEGSDGERRIFSYEQVRLTPEDTPYMYMWAGIPEAYILSPANASLTRNLLIMFLVMVLSLFISYVIGKNIILTPINSLLTMARKYAGGDLGARSALAEKTGEFGTLAKAFHDMADSLRLNQRTLLENESRFRLLMDSMDALVYVADMDTYEVLFINEYGKKHLGDSTGKICWQSLQKGQSGPCSFCTNKYLLDREGNAGALYAWEFQNTITGQWFYIRNRAIKWVDGRIVRLEIATDISERKLAETKLAEETERLAVTLKSIGDGVIATDTQGRILLINMVAETLTGWSSEEAAGRPFAEVFNIINRETRKPCENPVEKVLTSGNIIGLTNYPVLISINGQERTITDSGAPIRDKEGNIIGVVLVFRDITEQLRTEQELIKAKKLESIGVLAGGIAHDFNNILTALIGNIDLSLLDSNLTVKTRTLLTEALAASERARGLTHQLLTFAKGGEPVKETASLADVVKDSADFVLRGSKISCNYNFPEDLWLVDIDKNQISQVVQNIMLNASAAMPCGGIVEVSCENVSSAHSISTVLPTDGSYVAMKIKDRGVGIPANIIDKIFDPYFSTKPNGSGLGLAITHSIVRKHDGYITVQSTPGSDTTFTIYLPASTQHFIPVKKAEGTGLITTKSKIMVMDDEEQLLNIVREMIVMMGHEVVLARDGTEAVQRYKESINSGTPINLIVMDLTIPGAMGGTEAVQKILAINPEAKVMVSSGYSNDPAMANFKDYGFCGAIAKPYNLLEFKKAISQLIH